MFNWFSRKSKVEDKKPTRPKWRLVPYEPHVWSLEKWSKDVGKYEYQRLVYSEEEAQIHIEFIENTPVKFWGTDK